VAEAWDTDPMVVSFPVAISHKYAFTKMFGLSMLTVSMSYVYYDESNHGLNENFSLELFIQRIKITAHALEAIARDYK
jgi:hypothetical protein